jgi:hypothetical protein
MWTVEGTGGKLKTAASSDTTLVSATLAGMKHMRSSQELIFFLESIL